MAEWVEMKHEEIESTARVLRSSFDKIHRRKGWKLVKPGKVDKPAAKKADPKKVKSSDE